MSIVDGGKSRERTGTRGWYPPPTACARQLNRCASASLPAGGIFVDEQRRSARSPVRSFPARGGSMDRTARTAEARMTARSRRTRGKRIRGGSRGSDVHRSTDSRRLISSVPLLPRATTSTPQVTAPPEKGDATDKVLFRANPDPPSRPATARSSPERLFSCTRGTRTPLRSRSRGGTRVIDRRRRLLSARPRRPRFEGEIRRYSGTVQLLGEFRLLSMLRC